MRKITQWTVGACAALWCVITVAQPPGSLDPTFGSGGIVTTKFPGYDESQAHAVAVDGQGRIVVAGFAKRLASSADFAIARYLWNGHLDPSFGSGGLVTTDFFGNDDRATGIAIVQGRIVVGGYAWNDGDYDFVAARYLEDGHLDVSFGSGGKTFFYNPGDDIGLSLTADNLNRIIVAGYHRQLGLDTDFAAVRFTTSGVPDVSFAPSGYVLFKLTNNNDFGRTVTTDHLNRVIIAGYTEMPTAIPEGWDNLVVMRSLENGDLDPAFGTHGIYMETVPNYRTRAYSVSVQSDHKIVIGGSIDMDGYVDRAFLALRLLDDGHRDPTFGAGWYVTTNFYERFDEAMSVAEYPALSAAPRIVFGGYATPYVGISVFPHMALTCHEGDGHLYPSFGTGGKAEVSPSINGEDKIFDIALQTDGKIVAAGYSRPLISIVPDFAVVRFCSCYTTVGVSEEMADKWKMQLVPNPAASQDLRLTYYLPQADAVQIRLLHAGGGQIAVLSAGQRPAGEGNELLRIPDALPNGVYIVQFTTASQGTAHIRLIWVQ